MALRQSLSKTARLSNLLLYADRGVIILNKPPGLISQGGQTQVLNAFLVHLEHRNSQERILGGWFKE